MKKSPLKLSLLLTGAVLLLASCSSVKKELGVGRNSPDEFSVVKRAPLTLPPDYELRPPMEGSIPPAAQASSQAKAVLLGKADDTVPVTGSSDQQFLSKLGADRADPAIRATVDKENGFLALKNRAVTEKLIFWKDTPASEERIPTSEVDANAEKERLEKNKEEGKPVNDGKVPVIEKKKNTLDKIF